MISIREIDVYLRNEYNKQTIVKAIVFLVLFLYAARIAPLPPPRVLTIFQNTYFRLAAFTLILWIANFDAPIALFVSFTFLVINNYVQKGVLWEALENVGDSVESPAEAIKVLANAAMSPNGADIVKVAEVADVALSKSTNDESTKAITALAQQAIVPEAGVPTKVQDAVTTALSGIPAPTQNPSTGCYSKRVHSMDNVVPISSFTENESPFKV